MCIALRWLERMHNLRAIVLKDYVELYSTSFTQNYEKHNWSVYKKRDEINNLCLVMMMIDFLRELSYWLKIKKDLWAKLYNLWNKCHDFFTIAQ